MRGQRPDPVLERYDEGITTISYPEQKRPYPERFRGIHRLTQREDESTLRRVPLCCSTACPAQCIHIEPGEYPEGDKRRGHRRYPVKFVIDELRCIFCGYRRRGRRAPATRSGWFTQVGTRLRTTRATSSCTGRTCS